MLALLALRALPARLTGRRRDRLDDDRPLLAQMLGGGFILLGEVSGEELVIGIAGRFWRLRGDPVVYLAGAEDFVRFARPGFAKAALNFHACEAGAGLIRLRTDTRVYATDPHARRQFARYWRLIQPGSALIRLVWLRAIKRRAER